MSSSEPSLLKKILRVRQYETYHPFRVASESLHYLGILHIVFGIISVWLGVGLLLTKASFNEKWLMYTAGILLIATGLCALGVESDDYFCTAIPFFCLSAFSLVAAICLHIVTKLAENKDLDEIGHNKTRFISIISLSTAVITMTISTIILCIVSIILCFKYSSYLLCYGCREQFDMTKSEEMYEVQENWTQTDELDFMEMSIESMDPALYFIHKSPHDPQFLNQSPNDPQFLEDSLNDSPFQFSIENEIMQNKTVGSLFPGKPSSPVWERHNPPVQERPVSPFSENSDSLFMEISCFPSGKKHCSPSLERPSSPFHENLPSLERIGYPLPISEKETLSYESSNIEERIEDNVLRSPSPTKELQTMGTYSPTSYNYEKDYESFAPKVHSSLANKLYRSPPMEHGSVDNSLADSTFTPVPEIHVYSFSDSHKK